MPLPPLASGSVQRADSHALRVGLMVHRVGEIRRCVRWSGGLRRLFRPSRFGSTRTLGAGDENDDSGYQDGSQSREVEAMHGPYPHRLRDPAAPERYAPHTYLVPAPCSTVAAAL